MSEIDSHSSARYLHPASYVQATDPANDANKSIVPFSRWTDTTGGPGNYVEKFRNASNEAWINGFPAPSTLTNEQIQDIIGALLGDSATIDFVYDDAGNIESANVKVSPDVDNALAIRSNGLFATAANGGANLPSGSVTDGDKGDITVSSSGAVWIIDNDAVTTAKILNSNVTDIKIAAGVDAQKIGGGNVSNTEFSFLDGVTSAIQPQLAGREPLITAGTVSQYLRGDKTFQTLDKAAVGLSNVDNTSDTNKPVSTATQTAINLKANLASPSLTGTPTAPTAANGTNTTQLATTAFVTSAVSSSGVTDGDKGDIVVSVGGSVWTINSNIALSGNPTVTTQTAGNNSTRIATTAFVTAAVAAGSFEYGVAVSDETTALTIGTAKLTFRFPRAINLTGVRSSLSIASTSGLPTVDIKNGGTSIFGTNKLSIDATEKTSQTAATAVSFTAQTIADDAEITIDITVAGTGARGLKITFLGTRI